MVFQDLWSSTVWSICISAYLSYAIVFWMVMDNQETCWAWEFFHDHGWRWVVDVDNHLAGVVSIVDLPGQQALRGRKFQGHRVGPRRLGDREVERRWVAICLKSQPSIFHIFFFPGYVFHLGVSCSKARPCIVERCRVLQPLKWPRLGNSCHFHSGHSGGFHVIVQSEGVRVFLDQLWIYVSWIYMK